MRAFIVAIVRRNWLDIGRIGSREICCNVCERPVAVLRPSIVAVEHALYEHESEICGCRRLGNEISRCAIVAQREPMALGNASYLSATGCRGASHGFR